MFQRDVLFVPYALTSRHLIYLLVLDPQYIIYIYKDSTLKCLIKGEALINGQGGLIFSFTTRKTMGKVYKFSDYYMKNSR